MSDADDQANVLKSLQDALLGDDGLSLITRRGLDGELTDREKVEGLRGLVIVELASAKSMERSDYVMARIASYEFVLDAIAWRWPDAPYDWRTLVDELAEKMAGEDRVG